MNIKLITYFYKKNSKTSYPAVNDIYFSEERSMIFIKSLYSFGAESVIKVASFNLAKVTEPILLNLEESAKMKTL